MFQGSSWERGRILLIILLTVCAAGVCFTIFKKLFGSKIKALGLLSRLFNRQSNPEVLHMYVYGITYSITYNITYSITYRITYMTQYYLQFYIRFHLSQMLECLVHFDCLYYFVNSHFITTTCYVCITTIVSKFLLLCCQDYLSRNIF